MGRCYSYCDILGEYMTECIFSFIKIAYVSDKPAFCLSLPDFCIYKKERL